MLGWLRAGRVAFVMKDLVSDDLGTLVNPYLLGATDAQITSTLRH
jgi:hypothetical protein